MKTMTKSLNLSAFMAAAILFICGTAEAQDEAIAPPENVAQIQQQQGGTPKRSGTGRARRRHYVAPTAPTPPVPAGRLIDKSYFGMHIHNAASGTAWPPVTFGFVRLWDTGTDWASLEPSRGTFDFTKLDQLVALAEQHGVEVVLTLAMTPRWASARPLEPCPYGTGCAAEPAVIGDWTDYVRAVAARYRGRIKYYEIWNEPIFDSSYTGGRFFTGTPQKLVEMASAAYATIKAADPGAQVLAPPSAPAVSYIEPFLQAGGGKTFDVFTTHYYVIPPEGLVKEVADLKALLVKYGLQDKPMWSTEAGYNNSKVEGTSQPWYVFDVPTAAALTARHLIIGASSGLGRSALYAWDNGEMGFISLTTKQLNAEGIAYGTVATWLIGSYLQTCAPKTTELWQCELTRNGRRAWIIWSTVPNTAFQVSSLPVPIRKIVTLDGNPNFVVPAQLTVGIAPMLLMSDTSPW